MRDPHYIKFVALYTFPKEGVAHMSKPRITPQGKRNIVGAKVARLRKEKNLKQKELVATLQSLGMDISDTSMSRLEGQNRLVQDFEVPILAKALGVSVEYLLAPEEKQT